MSQGPSTWCPSLPDPVPPQDRKQLVGSLETAEAWCHPGWRPLLLTGLFRGLMTHHFTAPNIENPDLRTAIWREDVSSGILIESVYRWRGDMVEKRPAILIKRNAYQNVKLGIGNLAGTDGQGNQRFATMWVGSHTLFCIHGTGASCEILATEAQRELTQFGPATIQAFNLFKFQVLEVGTISELEEAKQNFVVPITIGWAYEEVWTLRDNALPLRSVDVDLGVCDP